MAPSAEVIRGKVDALRLNLASESAAQENGKAGLLSFLQARGLLSGEIQPLLQECEAFHDSGTVHRCPWHTCANTKH